jgi:hypothetical protein
MASFEELKAVKRRHAAEILRLPGVVGMDIDTDASGDSFLAVHLEKDDPAVRQQLPDELEGHPLRFVHTGPIRKQGASRKHSAN